MGRGLGLSVPLDDDAALLALSREHLEQARVDDVRHQVNYWHALQKLFRDACWDSANHSGFDGERFERESADWIRRYKDMRMEWGRLSEQREASSIKGQLWEDEFTEIWEAFWSESAGYRYV